MAELLSQRVVGRDGLIVLRIVISHCLLKSVSRTEHGLHFKARVRFNFADAVDVVRHAGLGDGRDGVDRHAVLGQLQRVRQRKAVEPRLGGTVVGLAEIALEPGDRGGVDDPAIRDSSRMS